MDKQKFVREVFKAIDDMDAGRFADFMADDANFKFANLETVSGREQINEFAGGFFSSIDSISHDIAGVYKDEDAIVSHGMVTYTRKDSSSLTVPFATIMKMNDEQIKDYLVHVDASELYK